MVTYNIGASLVTPHRPLEPWIAATRRTDPECREAWRVGLGGNGCCFRFVVFNCLFIQDALSLAGVLVPVAVTIVGHAALHHVVGPIGASELFSSKTLPSVNIESYLGAVAVRSVRSMNAMGRGHTALSQLASQNS